MPKDYDFAGWVTKNDVLCSDGAIIKHDAFKNQDGAKVPLVWSHNHTDPTNVLGHVILHNADKGVYGYGYFNDTEAAAHVKETVQHGDIVAMSIAANRLKRDGANVVHGNIYEVSLVTGGANPGALIDTIMKHSDTDEEEAIIYTGNLLHSYDDVLEHSQEGGTTLADQPEVRTIQDVLDTMTDEQLEAVDTIVASVITDYENDDDTEDDENIEHGEGGNGMKKNVFNQGTDQGEVITHSELNGIVAAASSQGVDSLREMFISELGENYGDVLQHGITGITALFPDAKNTTAAPTWYTNKNTASEVILAGVTKSPFTRLRNRIANLTEDEARARGYIKGKEKLEQVFDMLYRETAPQTIYKKQSLERDDIIDITDFDVVAWINGEMRMMLNEEIARAILVGDGRSNSDESKIREDKIRPIIKDDNFYTIKGSADKVDNLLEVVLKLKGQYRGSGNPKMFIHPDLLVEIKLLRGTDNRFLFGDIPTNQSLAARFGVSSIEETTLLPEKSAVIVNLADYTVGATKGGQVTTFDDFDIDFNKYKYLIETRLCGSLMVPKSAIYVTVNGTLNIPGDTGLNSTTMIKMTDAADGQTTTPTAPAESESGSTTGK